MGSNRRPKGDGGTIQVPRHKHVIEVSERATHEVGVVGNGNGAGTGSPRRTSASVCRKFGLVHRTATAQLAAVGMRLWGEFDGRSVRIHSDKIGELGDAPSQDAQFFISARNERGGGTLSGAVIKTTPHDVRVRLCIN